MKYCILHLIVLLVFASPCFSQDNKHATAPEAQRIQLVFEKYTAAIKTGQGNEALKYISQITIDYYDSLIYHALYSGEKELSKINIVTRTAILRMRHTQPLSYWDTMTAKKMLSQMWSKPEQPSENHKIVLADCKIEKNKATCTLQLNGQSTDMQSIFNKENNEWKIDITSINAKGIQIFNNDIAHRGISETEYILMVIEKLDGISVPIEDLYKPLKKR